MEAFNLKLFSDVAVRLGGQDSIGWNISQPLGSSLCRGGDRAA
jgi:hypothetical protein